MDTHRWSQMASPHVKRQNFDVSPEQEAEILWLRETLGAATTKETVLRAVRIAAVLSREVSEGKVLFLQSEHGPVVRLIIPELERPEGAAWRYLVERPHTWRRQPSIKGRRLTAATVWRDHLVNGCSFEETAQEWGIPAGAVEEAVRWCEANRDLIDLEAREERRRLADAGVAVAPPGR